MGQHATILAFCEDGALAMMIQDYVNLRGSPRPARYQIRGYPTLKFLTEGKALESAARGRSEGSELSPGVLGEVPETLWGALSLWQCFVCTLGETSHLAKLPQP